MVITLVLSQRSGVGGPRPPAAPSTPGPTPTLPTLTPARQALMVGAELRDGLDGATRPRGGASEAGCSAGREVSASLLRSGRERRVSRIVEHRRSR